MILEGSVALIQIPIAQRVRQGPTDTPQHAISVDAVAVEVEQAGSRCGVQGQDSLPERRPTALTQQKLCMSFMVATATKGVAEVVPGVFFSKFETLFFTI